MAGVISFHAESGTERDEQKATFKGATGMAHPHFSQDENNHFDFVSTIRE
jgi:hypothetical protein